MTFDFKTYAAEKLWDEQTQIETLLNFIANHMLIEDTDLEEWLEGFDDDQTDKP